MREDVVMARVFKRYPVKVEEELEVDIIKCSQKGEDIASFLFLLDRFSVL